MKKQYIFGTAPTPTTGQVPIVINDPKNNVSRNHCILTIDGHHIIIEDLGSLNGTFVNDIRITYPTKVNPYDQVLLAGKVAIYISDFIPKSFTDHKPPLKKGQIKFSQLGTIHFASFSRRMVAYFFDAIILTIPFYFVSLLTSRILGFPGSIFLELILVILMGHFYFAIPISKNGATIGRRMLNIQYLDLVTMDFPSVGRVWLRIICYPLSGGLLMIGFLMALFTEKKQALHDIIANTIVVKRES